MTNILLIIFWFLVLLVTGDQATADKARDYLVKHPSVIEQVTINDSTIANENYYAVSKVVDGDTVKVNIDGKETTLRLIGINTPETVDPRRPIECYGKEASKIAKELLNGKKVRLEKDETQADQDKYGRLLRYIYLEDGTNFNQWMIANGYAYEYTYDLPYKYQTDFLQAQKDAQDKKMGLWSDDTCKGEK